MRNPQDIIKDLREHADDAAMARGQGINTHTLEHKHVDLIEKKFNQQRAGLAENGAGVKKKNESSPLIYIAILALLFLVTQAWPLLNT